MDSAQITLLALIQGFTEFLPISSSAHLILAPKLFGLGDQSLAFDVALHIGSLLAVITYFRAEVFDMTRDFFGSFRTLRTDTPLTDDARMAWMIVLATLPVMFFGKLFVDLIQTELRSSLVIATTTILFALPLFWWDRHGRQNRDEYSIGWKDALIIGLFQAVALIPGTSRSGITITAAMMLGMSRRSASRFSFLLSIPTILMAGILMTMKLIEEQGLAVDWGTLLQGAFLSFISAYLCIHLFLKLIERISMLPFVAYRLMLGIFLFSIAL